MNTSYGDRLEAALSTQVKVELAERGMNQKDLAAALDMQSATLSRYMTNKTGWPMPVFFRVAGALGVCGSELMARAEARLGQ